MSSDYIKLRELVKRVLREKRRELMAGRVVQDEIRKNYPPSTDDEIWIDTKVSVLEGFVIDLENVLSAMGHKENNPQYGEFVEPVNY